MKKLLRCGLYSLLASGFIDVNAMNTNSSVVWNSPIVQFAESQQATKRIVENIDTVAAAWAICRNMLFYKKLSNPFVRVKPNVISVINNFFYDVGSLRGKAVQEVLNLISQELQKDDSSKYEYALFSLGNGFWCKWVGDLDEASKRDDRYAIGRKNAIERIIGLIVPMHFHCKGLSYTSQVAPFIRLKAEAIAVLNVFLECLEMKKKHRPEVVSKINQELNKENGSSYENALMSFGNAVWREWIGDLNGKVIRDHSYVTGKRNTITSVCDLIIPESLRLRISTAFSTKNINEVMDLFFIKHNWNISDPLVAAYILLPGRGEALSAEVVSVAKVIENIDLVAAALSICTADCTCHLEQAEYTVKPETVKIVKNVFFGLGALADEQIQELLTGVNQVLEQKNDSAYENALQSLGNDAWRRIVSELDAEVEAGDETAIEQREEIKRTEAIKMLTRSIARLSLLPILDTIIYAEDLNETVLTSFCNCIRRIKRASDLVGDYPLIDLLFSRESDAAYSLLSIMDMLYILGYDNREYDKVSRLLDVKRGVNISPVSCLKLPRPREEFRPCKIHLLCKSVDEWNDDTCPHMVMRLARILFRIGAVKQLKISAGANFPFSFFQKWEFCFPGNRVECIRLNDVTVTKPLVDFLNGYKHVKKLVINNLKGNSGELINFLGSSGKSILTISYSLDKEDPMLLLWLLDNMPSAIKKLEFTPRFLCEHRGASELIKTGIGRLAELSPTNKMILQFRLGREGTVNPVEALLSWNTIQENSKLNNKTVEMQQLLDNALDSSDFCFLFWKSKFDSLSDLYCRRLESFKSWGRCFPRSLSTIKLVVANSDVINSILFCCHNVGQISVVYWIGRDKNNLRDDILNTTTAYHIALHPSIKEVNINDQMIGVVSCMRYSCNGDFVDDIVKEFNLSDDYKSQVAETLKSSRNFRRECCQVIDTLSLINEDDKRGKLLNDNIAKYFALLGEIQMPSLVKILEGMQSSLRDQQLQQERVVILYNTLREWEKYFEAKLNAFTDSVVSLVKSFPVKEPKDVVRLNEQLKTIKASAKAQCKRCLELSCKWRFSFAFQACKCAENALLQLTDEGLTEPDHKKVKQGE